jgi:hypothetical protein
MFNSFHLNKQLDILRCQSNYEPKLFDYKIGSVHDNSLVDVECFRLLLRSYRNMRAEPIYFDNNTLL